MAIKDKLNETTTGQGFGGSQPKRPQNGGENSDATALAVGLETTLAAQTNDLLAIVRDTDAAAAAIAEPIADYFGSVVSGDLIMAKVAQRLQQSGVNQTVQGRVTVEAPVVPALPSTNMNDFFAAPKRITGV